MSRDFATKYTMSEVSSFLGQSSSCISCHNGKKFLFIYCNKNKQYNYSLNSQIENQNKKKLNKAIDDHPLKNSCTVIIP